MKEYIKADEVIKSIELIINWLDDGAENENEKIENGLYNLLERLKVVSVEL